MPILSFAALCLIWGTTWLAIKIGLQDFPPVLSAGGRFLVAALFLFVILKLKQVATPEDWEQYRYPAIFGVFNGLNYGLIYLGEQHISSSLTAILNTSLPFFSTLMGYYMLREEIGLKKVAALLLGFIGVIVVFSSNLGSGSAASLWGQGAIILAATLYSFGSVLLKKHQGSPDPLWSVTVQMGVSAGVLLVVGIPLEWGSAFRLTMPGIVSFLYLAIFGSAIAFLLYNNLLKMWEISRVSYINLITPLIASLAGVLWYAEPFNLRLGVGFVLVLAGVVLVNLPSICHKE
ncbi:MAG TPA: EamA family transporter [Bacillota bacterium]|nr:EamA family transporter [Bacillota bacterium]